MTTNRNKNKLKLRKQIETIDQCSLEGPIQSAIDLFTLKQEQYSNQGYTDIGLEFQNGYYEDMPDLVIYGYIEETDKEYTARMKLVEKQKLKEKETAIKYKEHIATEAKKLGIL